VCSFLYETDFCVERKPAHVQVIVWTVRSIVKQSWQGAVVYLASVHPTGGCMKWTSNHNFSTLLVCKMLETLHKVGPSAVQDTL